MSKGFITDSFLLYNQPAMKLYHEYAKDCPIFDYHSHLPVREIAENARFSNIAEIWLSRDHYKWRAMRTNGIEERLITGNATDYAKFKAWAATVPQLMRNPLYHWTHMELKTYFGIDDKLLGPDTADEIYRRCNDLLDTESFHVRALLEKMKVHVLCTTDDPTDQLDFHYQIRQDPSCRVTVLPTFRPDSALHVESPTKFNQWITKLEETSGIIINDFTSFILSLKKRHNHFHEVGCRLSDHGIEYTNADDYTYEQVQKIFNRLRMGKAVSAEEGALYKSAVLRECSKMDAEKNWTQQIHFGVVRNTNTRYRKLLGPDSGFDAIGDFRLAEPLIQFLDWHNSNGTLPKTVLYNINPCDNELIVSIMGCFQEGPVPSKLQIGPGWWFNDTKEGMIRQLNALSNLGLLSRFIGMTTDSRSFLSFIRHDYFRRILCNMLGEEIGRGELPYDIKFLGKTVKNICYNNATDYFGMTSKS